MANTKEQAAQRYQVLLAAYRQRNPDALVLHKGATPRLDMWLRYIASELEKTIAYIEALEACSCRSYRAWAVDTFERKQKIIAAIEDETGKEQALAQALEILSKK